MIETLFETTRLVVRHLADEDVDALFAVYGDAETMAPLGDGETLSRHDCERWVGVTRDNVARRGYGMSAVLEHRDDGSVGETIGFCGLVHPNNQEAVELKYALRRDRWACGYGSEMAAAMLAYGHDVHGLTRVIATIAPGNVGSQRLAEKIGMERLPELDADDVRAYVWHAT